VTLFGDGNLYLSLRYLHLGLLHLRLHWLRLSHLGGLTSGDRSDRGAISSVFELDSSNLLASRSSHRSLRVPLATLSAHKRRFTSGVSNEYYCIKTGATFLLDFGEILVLIKLEDVF
jgi:hypothetical protein